MSDEGTMSDESTTRDESTALSGFAGVWHRFWFDNQVLRTRLTTFRVAFFALLALDLWVLMVPHAPRHDSGAFNVSHIPMLDALIPNPDAVTVTVLYLAAGFFAFRVALGLALRPSLVALAVSYAVVYFWSQVDSYQHHYLIAVLLLLCCLTPWEETPGLDHPRKKDAPTHLRSWAVKLMYVQVSIVYFYTAVTKATPYWLDGWALERIITVDSIRELYASIGESLGWSDLGMYSFVAHAIMLWQFFVAFAFLMPKLRPLACLTGPIFHILVEVIDLKIGWFSYYMIAIYYVLLFPDAWFLAVARPVGRAFHSLRDAFDRVIAPGEAPTVFVAVGTVGLCLAAVVYVPLPGTGVVALVVGAAVGVTLWPGPRQPGTNAITRAVAHFAVAAIMLVSVRATDVSYDYYRFWAGDLNRRGHYEEAAEKYERANAAQPGGPARHFALGDVYRRLGRHQEALAAYRAGLVREPGSARGELAVAQLRREMGLPAAP